MAAIEQPIQKGDQIAVGGGVVYRTCHDNAVSFGKQRCRFIYGIIENAFAKCSAFPAGDAAPDGLGAYVQFRDFDAFLCENLLHFLQSYGGVAVFAGASVDY